MAATRSTWRNTRLVSPAAPPSPTLTSHSTAATTFNINGARTQDTEYFIDGAPAVRTRDDGELIAGANVDSVQEMQVLTADYSAEYGGASGAQVRIVTKSGTTNFHGSAYEYIRNAALNANTWTAQLESCDRYSNRRSSITTSDFPLAVRFIFQESSQPIS